MSKSTREADFRKVDVDELDEENFKDEETPDESQSQGQTSQNESEIKSLLSSYPPIECALTLLFWVGKHRVLCYQYEVKQIVK